MGIVFTVTGLKEWLNSRSLAARGVITTGEVMDAQERVRGRFRRHTYYLTVKFQDNNRPVTQKVTVNKTVFLGARDSGSVKVHYLAEDPTICAAGEKVEMRYGQALFGLVLLAGVAYLIVSFRQPDDREELVDAVEKGTVTQDSRTRA